MFLRGVNTPGRPQNMQVLPTLSKLILTFTWVPFGHTIGKEGLGGRVVFAKFRIIPPAWELITIMVIFTRSINQLILLPRSVHPAQAACSPSDYA